MILVSDHGRGINAEDWKCHGRRIPEADQIWMAVIGPDTPGKGEVSGECQFYQNQIAKTMAAFLGVQYTTDKTVGEVVSPMLPGNE